MSMNRFDKGVAGENAAADFLAESGLKIVDRNFRCPLGEIDLIGRDGKTVVFVEVRSRQAGGSATPEESITPMKRKRIVGAAKWYLKQRRLQNVSARFDVIAIRWNDQEPEINWIVNAFEARS